MLEVVFFIFFILTINKIFENLLSKQAQFRQRKTSKYGECIFSERSQQIKKLWLVVENYVVLL